MKTSCRPRQGFTLVELMVAMSITVMIVVLLVSIVGSVTTVWKHGENQTETFAQARGALSLIGREMQGMVIDLDLGYAIQEMDGDKNKIVFKFLSRRTPGGEDVGAVEKVAYQLAWASSGILPTVTPTYDARHPISVLIRTSNFQAKKGLNDVFDVRTQKAWSWVRNWGDLKAEVQTGVETADGDITEVMAQNVLQWQVSPVFWDSTATRPAITVDSAPGRYYDYPKLTSPKYITSDLKYVRLADPDNASYYTPDSAPRAIEIRFVSVPSNLLTRLIGMNGWSDIRSNPNLFDPSKMGSSPFDIQLKQNLHFFDSTYYLASRTP